jgi:hypothetical protein
MLPLVEGLAIISPATPKWVVIRERINSMIQRLVLLGALGLLLILAACAPSPASSPPAAETAERLAPDATETPVAVAASPTATISSESTAAAQTQEATVAPTTETAAAAEATFPTPHPNPECVAAPIPEDPNIAPVIADDWSKGRDDAPITLVEYSDFQ